eukprot:1189029-Prorocentrum_minimum.AAC.1
MFSQFVSFGASFSYSEPRAAPFNNWACVLAPGVVGPEGRLRGTGGRLRDGNDMRNSIRQNVFLHPPLRLGVPPVFDYLRLHPGAFSAQNPNLKR